MLKICRVAICLILLVFVAGCDERDPAIGSESAVPGVSNTEIVLGSSLALSGHAAYLGTQTLQGAQAYLNTVNGDGGVFGRRVQVLSIDDAYDPPRCLANTQRFIIDGSVFALFCYVGTPTTVKVLPLLSEARIPLLGMFTGANALREPFLRYAINIRASYYEETEAAIRHMVEDLGLKKIAVFYQYDAYGFDGLVGSELALKHYGLEPVARGFYTRGTLDVEEAVGRIHDSGAEAVVMVGTYSANAKFINLSMELGYDPIFYNVSFVGAEELARRVNSGTSVRVIMSQVVPPPDESTGGSAEGGVVSEYLKALHRYYPAQQPSFVGLEGFLNARILVEGLRRAGPRLTREGFIDAIESIHELTLGQDVTVSFGPDDHQGMDRVYFTKLFQGEFRPFENWKLLNGGN